MRGIRNLKLTVLFACIVPVLPWSALGQSPDAGAVDSLMREALIAWQVPGAAIAIVKNGEVVYIKGFGVKQLGGNEPVTPDTLFAIGSTTKAFTTTSIAMLVDAGKMSWDDPVRKHVEFFRLSDPLADENVTLRDIVSHRTGLNRNDLLWYGSPWSREEIIRKIGLVKLSRSFRSTYQYQNIMFLTAGYAVGAASKSTWENFVQINIFRPLGMSGANFSTTVAEKASDHSSPHRKNKDNKVEVVKWRNIDNIAPAGSINAGVRDLSKWVRFQLGDGTFEGKRLLSAAGLAETHTPQTVVRMEGPTKAFNPETTMIAYGLGWVVQDYRGQLQVSHGGNIDGFTARIALVPKAKLGIVILANLNGTQMNSAVSNSILDLALGLPRRDWNAIFAEEVRKQEAEQKTREKEREEKRHKGTKPSRDLAAYTGAYDEPAYGEASVYLEGGSLVLQWSNFRSRLEHYHFDTFIAKEDRLENEQAVFTLGADGEVAGMNVLGVDFKRVKPKTQERAATQ